MTSKRIAIFVDGSNFSAALRQLDFRPDYDKILSHYGKGGTVVGAYYFTALPPNGVETPLRKLTDRLQYHGWNLVTKETKTLKDSLGRQTIKGNMDVEIAVKAWKLADKIDELVLFSGDGDFRSLVEELQNHAVRVTAVSVHRRDSLCMIADELRKQVDVFTDLKELQPHIDASLKEKRLRFLEGK